MILDDAAGPSVRPAAEDSEHLLVRRMAAGDRAAHRALYEAHARDVLGYLVGRVGGDRALAEDLLHEVMLAAWRGASRFREESRVRTWLLGIAHHRAGNALRARRRERLVAEPAEPPRGPASRNAGRSDERVDLRRALGALPEGQRAALELVFLFGLSTAEAGEVLGVAQGTVKSRLYRAKARMRDLLDRERERDDG